MSFSKAQANAIISILEGIRSLVADEQHTQAPGKARNEKGTRSRRSGKELVAFRRMLKAERKAGVSVADLAKKHSITQSYIYGLK